MSFRGFVVHVILSLLSEIPPSRAVTLLSIDPAAQSYVDDDEM